MLHSSTPRWISKCRCLVQTVVSAASGAYCENLPELDSRGLFSLSMPPPRCPAWDLFVFSHGLMSQTQVSLIINDPWVAGPCSS